MVLDGTCSALNSSSTVTTGDHSSTEGSTIMAERKPRPKNYTAQLTYMTTPEQAGRVRAWASVRRTDLAALCREIMAAGLEALEPQWEIEAAAGRDITGPVPLDDDFLAEHVRQAVK